MTACTQELPQGITVDVRVRIVAPGTLGARLDALVAVGGRCEAGLLFGLAVTQQHQQQAEAEQLHSHPAVRVKLSNDVLQNANLVISYQLKKFKKRYICV